LIIGQSTNFLYSMEDYMRGLGLWGRAVTALIALFVGMSVAGVKYVAVVETEVDAQSGVSTNLNPAEVREITAEIRRQATENLPSERYSVMTSETVQSMGGAVLEECAEENCVIALGSKIGADYIVRGTISKFQTKFTLAIELYETENGTLIVSSEAIRSGNLEELLGMATVACANMYKKFTGAQSSTLQPKPKQTTTSSVTAPANISTVSRNPNGMCTLTTNVSPSDGGSVERNPKKEIYTVGEKVTITATPAKGCTFTGWTGTVVGDKANTWSASKSGDGRVYKLIITMDSDKTLIANFKYSQQTLTINVAPVGSGSSSTRS
jgi:hypothetical protein